MNTQPKNEPHSLEDVLEHTISNAYVRGFCDALKAFQWEADGHQYVGAGLPLEWAMAQVRRAFREFV